jgi:peptidylprolyl isomerase
MANFLILVLKVKRKYLVNWTHRAAQMAINQLCFKQEKDDDGFIEGLEKLAEIKALLFIPSHLAYGGGTGDVIPPNTNIIFEVEFESKPHN